MKTNKNLNKDTTLDAAAEESEITELDEIVEDEIVEDKVEEVVNPRNAALQASVNVNDRRRSQRRSQ